MHYPDAATLFRAQALALASKPVPYVPARRKRVRCTPGMVRASDMFAALDPQARWAFSQMHPAEAQRLERALLKRLRRGKP